jgi:DNA polymerase-3 subunit delta
MAATFESVKKDIVSKSLKPIYLLKGEESYYLEVLSKEFEDGVLEEFEKDFNMSVFYGKDASIDSIISSAKQ